MSLRDLVVAKIAQASGIVESFQSTVQLHAWISQSGSGKPTYADPVPIRALLDLTRKQRYVDSGKLILITAEITILDVVAANGAAGRSEPIDPRDKFVLPDGRTSPIVQINAFQDPTTNAPFLNVVTIGEVLRG